MNEKIAHAAHKEQDQLRREQMGCLLSLYSLSMSGTRHKHINTSPLNDLFNVEELERRSAFYGHMHAELIKRSVASFDSFTQPHLTPSLQRALAPYADALGIIDDDTSLVAMRTTLIESGGRWRHVWHYSISLHRPDLYPTRLNFTSLRAFAVHIALGRVIRGEITRGDFIMFCSDTLSTNAFLTLNDDFVHWAKG